MQQSHSGQGEGSSQHGNGSPAENPALNLAKSESDRIKAFYHTVLSVIVVFIVAALSGYKDMKPLYSTTNHTKVHLSNLLVAEGLCMIVTFICAIILMMYEFYAYHHEQRGRGRYRDLTVLVAITGTMLIATDTVLVAITNRGNAVLSVLLVPVLLLGGVAARAGAWMENPAATQGSEYDTAMKSSFDLATVGTIAAFTLQGTIAFSYLKTPHKKGKRDPPLDLAVCYATSTVCLVAMMVCAMPLALLPGDKLKVLVGIVERLRHVLLASLALMALVVSVEFLDGFVVLSFFPEAIALVLYCGVEFCSARQPREGGSRPLLDFVFRVVATVGFTLMTGLYGAFLGTDHYSVYLKAAMFVLLLAVVSSLSRLAIPFHLPDNDIGGALEVGVATVVLAFPAVALLLACPLVLKAFLDLYLNR